MRAHREGVATRYGTRQRSRYAHSPYVVGDTAQEPGHGQLCLPRADADATQHGHGRSGQRGGAIRRERGSSVVCRSMHGGDEQPRARRLR